MIGNRWNTCMYFLTANVMKCHEPTTFSLMGFTQNQMLLCLRTG